MKQIEIIPKAGFNLYGSLIRREIEHRQKARGTFYRVGARKKNEATWHHKQHPGWVKIARGMGGVVLAEIRTKAHPHREWPIFQAFLGFLDRHFGENLAAINVQYRSA